ncbi:histidine phosphatase family protein [Aquamicrobium lusatiense]|uniref:SixA phosphatase family protein n=1 Tax=Aquamicrobium lusatiense TaxID=89772 RepID=UPI002455FA4F|nr:histidine phosphatase family protein [Aquamicrobium lusatiense]MDH4990237.1 histidine phosphatase family protein [Aquamicrobium lusatiense]
MRQLFLLRHAKSSWDDPSLSDFQRPLANRGRRAAPLMGREMARRGWLPDLALISSSVRTRQTWELVSAQWKNPCTSIFTETIYEADPAEILAGIRKMPDEAGSLLVIGHNPGLELLAGMLAGPGSPVPALEKLERKFPTAAIVRLEIGSNWQDLSAETSRLTDFITPKDIA